MRIVFEVGAVATCWAILLGYYQLHATNVRMGFYLLRDWFWSYAEPGIVCEPDSFVVFGEDVVTLMPVFRIGFGDLRGGFVVMDSFWWLIF